MNKIQTDDSTPVKHPQAPEATCSVRLSARDAAEVVASADTPPVPNEAALQAARRFLQSHG